MSAISDLTAAIVTALNTPPLAGGNVFRGYAWPMAESVNEEIFVRPESSNGERVSVGNGPVDWRTVYRVEIRVRFSPDSTSADAAVDDLLAAAYARLAALSVPGVQDIVPGVSLFWDYTGADSNVAAVSFTAEVLHRTEAATLTAWT